MKGNDWECCLPEGQQGVQWWDQRCRSWYWCKEGERKREGDQLRERNCKRKEGKATVVVGGKEEGWVNTLGEPQRHAPASGHMTCYLTDPPCLGYLILRYLWAIRASRHRYCGGLLKTHKMEIHVRAFSTAFGCKLALPWSFENIE